MHALIKDMIGIFCNEQMSWHKEGILKTSQWGIPENKDARNMTKCLKEYGAQYFVFVTIVIPEKSSLLSGPNMPV
jgi:hypothetical protein